MRAGNDNRPSFVTAEQNAGRTAEVIFRENILEEQKNRNGTPETTFVYDEYRLTVPYRERLEKSDKQVAFDRMGLDTSFAVKFIASLMQVLSGAWARYRQQLRDLPEQPMSPFDVNFPEMPEK